MSNMITKTLLLRSTILVGTAAFALPAIAQTAAPTTTQPGTGTAVSAGSAEAAASQQVADNESVITVTGSLIKNPNLVRSAPVTVTTADEINLRQSNVAEDILREIPGVVPSIGSAVNNGNGGASFVDLRGLGSNRNIVLLDGVRLVPSGFVGRVDLNNIPLALINRVEALTGSAVTTYGADAVTGVVNFITKQDFTGIEFNGSEQINGKGDGNYYRTDLTIGGNFADDKGNAVLSIGYQHADPVYQGDRSFGVNNVDSYTGANGGSSTSVPTRFSTYRGIDPTTGQPSTTPAFSGFDPVTGKPIPTPGGQGNPGSRYVNPTSGAITTASSPFNFNPYNLYETPFQRYNIYGQAKYDVSDAVQFYTRGLFSKNVVSTVVAPSGIFGSSVVIPLSNPYLPAAARNQFCALNVAPQTTGPATVDANGKPVAGQQAQTTYVPQFTPAQCAAAATATSATDPNYRTVTTTVQRRLVEGGSRIDQYTTTVFDYHLGVRGKISDHLDYDLNGSYGQSENRQSRQGYTSLTRVRDALLATNPNTCLSGNAGCVPLNLFGPAGSITPAMAQYLSVNSSIDFKTSLAQAHGTVSGDLGFASPFGKDPIGFAVGAEYRKYSASQDPDLLAQTPGELGGAGGAIPQVSGGYQVKEAFGELIAPLVQDKPFFQNLTVEAGIRYSDYIVDTPTHPHYSTTTYKGGGTWEPGGGFKIRGDYSRAVRAPNINELFTPVTVGLTTLATDPCAGAAPTVNANLKAICIAQGAPVGTIGAINLPTASQANESAGGNLNLKPEKADTYTVGFVFQPTFFRGFSITADYYNIAVRDAITTPTTGDILAACFGADPANPPAGASATTACTSIRRNPVTGGLDGDAATTLGLPAVFSNLGKLATDGIDVTANYSRDIGFAKLGLSFLGNYTRHQKFQATPTAINRECVGYYSANCGYSGSLQPKFQWTQRTTLGFDSFDISLLWRHIDGLKQEPLDALPANNGPAAAGFGTIPATDYFDLAGRVNIAEHMTLTLTVSNLLDKSPPIVGSTIGQTAYNSGNTYPSTYDPLGRRFALGVRVRY